MKSKKLFISVRFILEPLYIVRSPPKFIGQKITASAFTTPTAIDLKHKKTAL
ncbi:TPA: hypothetical protein ACU2I5_002726 [Staphylococcus aureus]